VTATTQPGGGAGDLAWLTASELRVLLGRRELSAVEVAQAALRALDGRGRALNAVAELTEERALADARRADEMLRAGEATPLTGIPYGAKDLLATEGIPTRWGSPAHRDQTFGFDATVIKRMRAAGAVLVGKLAMVELAGGGGYSWPAASANGPGINPWSQQHWSGGSSSGSASAVGAGLLPLALGSETGGSILVPSSFCGITGLRPTLGAVSCYGAMPLSWSMDKLGPMARTALDCEAALEVLAGRDEDDPLTSDWRYERMGRRPIRLGVLEGDARWPATSAALTVATVALEGLGCEIVPLELPHHNYRETYEAIIAGECALAHRSFIESAELRQLVSVSQQDGLRGYLDREKDEYAAAVQHRVAVARDIRSLFIHVDILASPTVVSEAITLTDSITEWRKNWHPALLGALAGIPGITLPMGIGPNGLPLGLTLMSDKFHEGLLMGLAIDFQNATDWHLRRPPELQVSE